MTSLAECMRAGLATATLASAQGRRTGAELLEAAQRLADWIDRQPPGPVISTVSDAAATAVTTLAGDLAARPVLHADPSAPATHRGIVVKASSPTRAGYRDELVGLHATAESATTCIDAVPARSQVFFTSGSTGKPEGVVRPAAAVLADASHISARLGLDSGRRVLVSAPVQHVYGFNYGLIAPLYLGGYVYYTGPRVIPSQVAQAAYREQADTLIGHPALYHLLAQNAGASAAADLSPLRLAVSAGAPLPPGSVSVITGRHRFELNNCYGSSEAGAITLSAIEGGEPPGDAGLLLDEVDASTADGELLLRSPSLAAGYLTATGLGPLPTDGGRYRTGDLAELSGRRVQLKGRVANVINVAGRKVSPEEVEAVLMEHPGIIDAEVYAEPDQARGQLPVAAVTVRGDLSVAEVLGWCRGRLAPHQVPRRVEVRDQLARTETGKRIRHLGQADRP